MNVKYKGKIYNPDHLGIHGKYYIALVTFAELPTGSLFYRSVNDKNANEWYGRFHIKHNKKESISLAENHKFYPSEYVFLYIDVRRYLVHTLGQQKLLPNKDLIKLNTLQFS
jgi:hypothetical protein